MPIEAAASDFSTETEEEKKSIELLRQRLSNFETEQGRLQGLSYRPRPNDVGITTTPKVRHIRGKKVSYLGWNWIWRRHERRHRLCCFVTQR